MVFSMSIEGFIHRYIYSVDNKRIYYYFGRQIHAIHHSHLKYILNKKGRLIECQVASQLPWLTKHVYDPNEFHLFQSDITSQDFLKIQEWCFGDI